MQPSKRRQNPPLVSYSAGVSKLEDLAGGAVADGIEPNGLVTVVSAVWHGDQAITLTYRDTANRRRVHGGVVSVVSAIEGGPFT